MGPLSSTRTRNKDGQLSNTINTLAHIWDRYQVLVHETKMDNCRIQ
jgi:hypothetical protein